MANVNKNHSKNCTQSAEVVAAILPELNHGAACNELSMANDAMISNNLKSMGASTKTEPTYVTVRQLASDPSLCFSIPMWRWYILKAHKNGLAPAIRRIGKKVVLRRDLVIKWIESHARRV